MNLCNDNISSKQTEMNGVKNHWGGEVIHGTPRPSPTTNLENSCHTDKEDVKDGESFFYGGKEWIQVKKLSIDEVRVLMNDRPSCLSPKSN